MNFAPSLASETRPDLSRGRRVSSHAGVSAQVTESAALRRLDVGGQNVARPAVGEQHVVARYLLDRGRTLEIDPVLPPSMDGLTATVPLDGQALHLTYSVGPLGHGPTAVSLNGAPIQLAPLTNPYRLPGVRVDLAQVITALRNGPCTPSCGDFLR